LVRAFFFSHSNFIQSNKHNCKANIIPIISIFRDSMEQMWLTCFHFSWKCLFSRLVSFYLLLSLNLVAVASEYPTPSTYACEDVANYYSPLKHFRLKGEKLKRKLNSIIAPHHSLSYQEVIHVFIYIYICLLPRSWFKSWLNKQFN
jgi:hypothetical protein